MIERDAEYEVPGGTVPEDVLAAVGKRWRLVEGSSSERTVTYYDTFDWALFLDGGVLRYSTGPEGGELLWQDLDPGTEVLAQPVPGAPGFAADLPPGPVRERIQDPGGIRRLLPRMHIDTSTRILTLKDRDGTGGAGPRLAIDERRFRDPEGGRSGALGICLRVPPARDGETGRELLAELLADAFGLAAPGEHVLLSALAASGRRPADYSSKLDYRLDPLERADGALRTILLGLLETVERNLAGARAGLDSEFLHDLRVAVRRTRSALGQIRPVFPGAVVERFKVGFAWIQQATGPVRDLDVYLLDFEDYRAGLPASLQGHLDPLRTYILSHYDGEQARLARILASPQLSRILAAWRAFLESPLDPHPEAPGALAPAKEIADACIRRLEKRVRKEGRAIGPDSPPAEMHELRKSCKKLRYLMEFFQSLYPEDIVRDLVKLMKELLDNLGTFQDLSVQTEHLRDLARRMADEGAADTDTLLAMGALIGQLSRRREQAREGFSEVFAGFLADETRDRFRALRKSQPQPQVVP